MYFIGLSTALRESTPCQIPPKVAFTLLYMASFFSSTWSRAMAATAQTAVTSHPAVEKRPVTESIPVPVALKNVLNTRNCASSVTAVTSMITSESTALSVTTVPKALEKDTPS